MSEDDGRAAEGMARARGGRGAVVAAVVTGGAIIAAGWWALGPLPAVEIGADTEERGAAPVELPPLALLDEAAFGAPLWIAPPAPPKPPPRIEPRPAPAATPKLNLLVLAIARDVKGVRALLYDPETNRPEWVEAGGVLGGRVVERVSDDAVVIRDGVLSRSLKLREPAAPGTALERALVGGRVRVEQ